MVEIDGPLVDLVRRELPWDPKATLRVRVGDAREAVTGMREQGYDVVVVDVFAGSRTPAHLASVADGPPLTYARTQVATIRAVLPQAVLVADAAVLRGRRFGNLVVLAGRTPQPVAELSRRAAGDWFPGRVETDLDRFASGRAPATDIDALPSPAPPEGLFSART